MIRLVSLCFLVFFPGSSGPDLAVGDIAPDFHLPYATRDTIVNAGISLSEAVKSDIVVLAFYPADWSGGCTTEMCTMRDNFGALADLGVTVFGISGDYVFSHHEWAKYHNLPFALLSDHTHTVAQSYNSYNPATGRDKRTIFVINRKQMIAYVDYAFRADSHASFEALESALRAMQ